MQHASKKAPQAGADEGQKKPAADDSVHRGPINSHDKFRDALSILFTSMLMVVAALPNKPRIQITARQSRKWQQHIDELADSKPRPSLRVLINGEFLGRQKAIALSIDDGTVYGDASDEVRQDLSFWNKHVHRPAEGYDDELEEGDFGSRSSSKRPRNDRGAVAPRPAGNTYARTNAKGKGKGKGKQSSRSSGSFPQEFHGKASRTPPSQEFPSGQPICFDYHINGRCSCNGHRSHACPNRKGDGFCFGDHRMTSRSCPGSG